MGSQSVRLRHVVFRFGNCMVLGGINRMRIGLFALCLKLVVFAFGIRTHIPSLKKRASCAT